MSGGRSPFPNGSAADRVHEALRTVLADVLGWRTTPQRWEHIRGLVAAVERAAVKGDTIALGKATTDLELAVPVRNNRIERPPGERTAIDDNLRERINRLQHSFGTVDSDAGKEETGDHSGGDR